MQHVANKEPTMNTTQGNESQSPLIGALGPAVSLKSSVYSGYSVG